MATPPTALPSTDFDSGRIKRIRGALGLTQTEFADFIGVHVNSVIRWETGDAKPRRGHVIAKLLVAEQKALAALQAASQGVQAR